MLHLAFYLEDGSEYAGRLSGRAETPLPVPNVNNRVSFPNGTTGLVAAVEYVYNVNDTLVHIFLKNVVRKD